MSASRTLVLSDGRGTRQSYVRVSVEQVGKTRGRPRAGALFVSLPIRSYRLELPLEPLDPLWPLCPGLLLLDPELPLMPPDEPLDPLDPLIPPDFELPDEPLPNELGLPDEPLPLRPLD